MGDGPIPWTVIEQYANALQADEVLRGLLHYHIRGMDRVVLKKKGGKDGSERTGKANVQA